MVSWGQKFKMPKTCKKQIYKNSRVVLSKNTSRKNTKYSTNETILKIGHVAKAIAHAEAIAFAKWSVWVKNVKCQKHGKMILQEHSSCSVQKTAPKNTKYSRNETILKIGHLAKPIAHVKGKAFKKWSPWVKN